MPEDIAMIWQTKRTAISILAVSRACSHKFTLEFCVDQRVRARARASVAVVSQILSWFRIGSKSIFRNTHMWCVCVCALISPFIFEAVIWYKPHVFSCIAAAFDNFGHILRLHCCWVMFVIVIAIEIVLHIHYYTRIYRVCRIARYTHTHSAEHILYTLSAEAMQSKKLLTYRLGTWSQIPKW